MSQKPENIIDKIWKQHVVMQTEGHPAVFGIDMQLTHEVTSPQGFSMLREKGLKIKFPHKQIATLDHSIPTREDREIIYDKVAEKQVQTLRKNTKDFNLKIYDFGSGNQGIVHVIGPELGITQPGMTIVCGDSHTSTHGAFGALAFGVGSTEVGLVMATGCILQRKPKTMKVEFKGSFKPRVYSKDAILKLISQIGVGGANGFVIEFCGQAVREMSMEARMSMCNMSIECGARAGLVAPDKTTFDYIKGKKYAPKDDEWEEAVDYWKSLVSDKESKYDAEIIIDVSELKPMVTWGTNPSQGIEINQAIPNLEEMDEDFKISAIKALDYVQLKPSQKIAGTPIQWAFLGSCTNSRIEDLRIAAKILKNNQVAGGVTMYVVPGSEAVKKQAETEGLKEIFEEAGAIWRNPGCSMCLGMNDDKVPAGQRCISTSNRNFVGRQGTGSITHLASPATVAYSAIRGVVSDVGSA